MNISRREFLAASAAGIAASAGRLVTASPANVGAGLPAEIRVGIIGLEGHYSDVTGAAKFIPAVRVTGIADARPGFSAKGPLASAKVWTDYRKMLAEEKFDLLCVCGPNGERAAVLEACAEKRLPIITEKPLALTYTELNAVKRALQRSGAPFTMLLTMRFTPTYSAMRQIVSAGEIGEVLAMDAQKSYKLGDRPDWMKSRKTFGGTIPYIGVHMIDLMRWVSGREMTQVAAFQGIVGAPGLGEMENVAALTFKLDNGGTASLRMDYQRPETATTHGDDRLRVVGTKGIVEYQEREGLTVITSTKPLRHVTELPAVKSLAVDFIESIYLGRPHGLSAADIYRVSAIVLKSREAAERGKVVPL